ncbi:hypothetical protein HY285_05745 [Candidatus Peregrinibacteria bacterium]|nr:hypothetical protein [Candidatus Peregrinibacteria bacterium]MBI3817010.1 hypothetical protein [Candidatus Peregrinibacteria bacterium]
MPGGALFLTEIFMEKRGLELLLIGVVVLFLMISVFMEIIRKFFVAVP